MYTQGINGSFLKQCADIVGDLKRKGEKPDKDGYYHIHFSGIVGKCTYNALFNLLRSELQIVCKKQMLWTPEFTCCGILFSTDPKNHP